MPPRSIRAIPTALCPLILIVMVTHAEAAAGTPWQAAYPLGGLPFGLVRADFNEDGTPDVVASNDSPFTFGPPALTLLLGRPDGTFGGMVPLPLLSPPQASVATGDLNHDGHADLWVLQAHGVSNLEAFGVLLGNGDGTFATERLIPVGLSPEAIAAADFDSDGDLDIAVIGVSSAGTGALQVFAGDGAGGFTAAPEMRLARVPGLIRVGDLNHDGHPDLVLGQRLEDPQGVVTSLLGTGDLRFVPVREQALTAQGLLFIELSDLNEDGREDLVAGYAADPSLSSYLLSVFPAVADGSFGAASFTTSFDEPRAAAFADLDADGHKDMVASGNFEVMVLKGLGNGAFRELSRSWLGNGHDAVLLDDVNRDGRRDLLVTSPFSQELFVVLGNGDGSFGAPTSRRFLGAAEDGAVVADFNEDGHADIAAAMISTSAVAIALGDGRAGFGHELAIAVSASPRDLVAADFNRDGHVDLAVATLNVPGFPPPVVNPPGSVTVLLGRGDGTFLSGGTVQVDPAPRSMSVGDVNGDGIPDLAIAHSGDPFAAVPGSVAVLVGLGDGRLVRSASLQAGLEPVGVALADLDGDGDADLAVASRGDLLTEVPGDLSIFPGNGDGTFGPRTILATGSYPSSVLVADADADGRTDLIFVDQAPAQLFPPSDHGGVTVFRGQADGTLGPGEKFEVGLRPAFAFIADLDRDGVPDLNVACLGGHVTIAGVDATGRFVEKSRIATGSYPRFAVPGDFDEDGATEVAVSSFSGFSILREFPVVRDVFVKGRALSWSTVGETNLSGFNVVAFDRRLGRVQLNTALIACGECVTGRGDTYSFSVAPGSTRNLYVEAVYLDGRRQRFGPAQRH
ncbi:MAG TPA: VCBS repeat-containing protein [Candidatus Polarisedimenticolia bacterium]|nr:VCBS repeat-containing protein [Candidatus Polarisedimenticolia bacterium]